MRMAHDHLVATQNGIIISGESETFEKGSCACSRMSRSVGSAKLVSNKIQK